MRSPFSQSFTHSLHVAVAAPTSHVTAGRPRAPSIHACIPPVRQCAKRKVIAAARARIGPTPPGPDRRPRVACVDACMAWVAVSTRQLPGRPAPLESDAWHGRRRRGGPAASWTTISLTPSPLHANHAFAKRPAGEISTHMRGTRPSPTEHWSC